MHESYDSYRQISGTMLNNMPHGSPKIGSSVCKKSRKHIVWHHDHPDIHVTRCQFPLEVHYINGKKIASAGDLNFHPNG